MFRIVFITLLCIGLCSCSTSMMHKPMLFNTTAEFTRQLQTLKEKISEQEYKELTDAIGYLKISDTKNVSITDFYQSLKGKTPAEIIQQAKSTVDFK